MLTLLLLALLTSNTVSQPVSWTNPLVMQRADPHVTYVGGQYLLTATAPEYDRIEIRRAPALDGLRAATPHVIWRRHASGPMSWHIWAPELHRIDGKWYVYFAAGRADDIWAIRMYVLENASPDPFTGSWIEKGQIKTKWETFALDATTFVHCGERYLAWAQKDPDIKGNTNLYLAKMDTPWSIVGDPVRLSKPDLPWEQVKYWVNEGPAVLIRNGRVFMTYSASATNEYYCMGLLTADANRNLLDPAAWHKSPQPVFATWSVSGVFGPGHNSFTTTPDGRTDVMVYHARNYREITGHELNNPDRHTRAQPLRWRPDGTPDFGVPVPDGPLPRLFNPALRDELLAMRTEDQRFRSAVSASMRPSEREALLLRQHEIDTRNMERLERIIERHGWPGRSLVGEEASQGAFLILQHADLDRQKKYFPLVKNAVVEREAHPSESAMLEDRILMVEGKKQIYGTQVRAGPDTQGRLVLHPIEDEPNVDGRRAAVGLPPLAEYLRQFGITYVPPKRR